MFHDRRHHDSEDGLKEVPIAVEVAEELVVPGVKIELQKK